MSYQREFDKRLRVGLVGVGSHAYRVLLPTMNFLPVELVAFCDVNEPLARKTAKQYGVPSVYTSTAEMYEREELDAVFLCVSPQLHPALCAEATRAGLHVWMEKPPAMRAARVREMIDARGDRVVVVGFKKAFMPATRKVKSLLADVKHQPLRSLWAQRPMRVPANGREVLETGEMTEWLGNGVHLLSLMIEVGGPVRQVTTFRASPGDGGAVILDFRSGAVGTFLCADGGPFPSERCAFFGNGCEITIENAQRVTYQRGIPFKYGRTTNYAPEGTEHGAIVWEPQNCLATLETNLLFTQGFYDEMMYFCQCVLDGTPADTGSLEFAHQVMKVYEAALLSDRVPVQVE